MEFGILGPLEVREDGQVLPLPGRRHGAVLAILLLRANEVIPTERLIEELWGKRPTRNAATALYGYVSQLRKALGGRESGPLVTRTPGYAIELEPEQLDAARFERLLADGRATLRGGDPAVAARTLRQALGLWRGPALSDFALESFAQTETRRLEELRVAALEERIEADLVLGQHADLIGELETLVADHPLRERLRRQLMLALYRCGRQAEALEAYRRARQTLVEELGIEPGGSLRALEQAILRQDPDLDAEQSPPPSEASAATAAEPRARVEERKVVSVLLVDVVAAPGGSDLSDPEDAREALGPVHSIVESEVGRHGGIVKGLIGDDLIAVFGAPVVHEDDPERAVRAALAIRDRVEQDGASDQLRMVLSTGTALVSLDSRPGGSDTAVTGNVFNAARRLLASAPIGAIVVGKRTYRATREAIDYRELSSTVGKEELRPNQVWEARSARSRSSADLVRGPLKPLVGRERELDLLVSTLRRVREERSQQLVTLVGVPGIGKSRLVLELAEAVDRGDEAVSWRRGRCLPYGEGVSFWALGEVVKAQAGILESDHPEEVERKLHQAIVEVIGDEQEAAWVEEQLRPLVGAAGEQELGQRSGEAFPAWRRFLEALAERRPLALVIEDLHWADSGLLEFLDELADRTRDTPLLVLCTARPEMLQRQPGWGGGKANALTISLPPLSDDDTARVVANTLERPLVAAEVQESVLTRAAGNPLYAEQFARVVSEVGQLDELPETVHGIIAARLDGLTSDEKALLQDAAVVGKVFWLGALETTADVPRRQAEELLVGLERKEFVRRSRRSSVAGDAEYSFGHVLLRDVAYGQIPRTGRSVKHQRVAAWIESLGRPDDHADMLAHHYLSALEHAKGPAGEDNVLVERARLALRAAGDRALALAAYAAAARFYHAALELWPSEDGERVWLLVHAGRARYGDDGTGIDLLEQGFEELRSRGDADGAAEVAVEISLCFLYRGDRETAYAYIDRALELAEGRAESRAKAHALAERAAYLMRVSRYPEAIRAAREALPLTEALGMKDRHARALDVLGISSAMTGDTAGLAYSKRGIAVAREANAFVQLVRAQENLYSAQFSLGQVGAAWETLAGYLRDADRYGSSGERPWARGLEAYAALHQGRWAEAEEIFNGLIRSAETRAPHYMEATWRALRASIELARGDLTAAAGDSEKALDRARGANEPQNVAPALVLRAIVLVAHGLHSEASKLASEALSLRDSLVGALLQNSPAATPIEFAWLLRDLAREKDLLPALASAPSTPWVETARAITNGQFSVAVEIVARLGLPVVEAYTRLRAAEQLALSERRLEAREQLAPALVFFRKVGANRYIGEAEELLKAST